MRIKMNVCFQNPIWNTHKRVLVGFLVFFVLLKQYKHHALVIHSFSWKSYDGKFEIQTFK